jgi:hypothetical protein
MKDKQALGSKKSFFPSSTFPSSAIIKVWMDLIGSLAKRSAKTGGDI